MMLDLAAQLLNAQGLDMTVVFLGLWSIFILVGVAACAAVCWSRMR